jgi:hypothetical protein
MRVIAVILALSAACGGPLAVSASGGRLATKKQAEAFVSAVNLRVGDVPGFKGSTEREHETAAEKRLEQEMLRCAGWAGFGSGIAEGSSPSFKRETGKSALGVSSSVSVARSSAVAAKELAAMRSGRTKGCLSHYLDQLFKGQKDQGATFSPVTIVAVAPPAPGTSGSFGWVIAMTITLHRVALPVYLEILGFTNGPAEVTLFTSSLPTPFPSAIEHQLFSLLVERAKSHPV